MVVMEKVIGVEAEVMMGNVVGKAVAMMVEVMMVMMDDDVDGGLVWMHDGVDGAGGDG